MPRTSPCTVVLHSTAAAPRLGEQVSVEAEEVAAEPEDRGDLVLEDIWRGHRSFSFLTAHWFLCALANHCPLIPPPSPFLTCTPLSRGHS